MASQIAAFGGQRTPQDIALRTSRQLSLSTPLSTRVQRSTLSSHRLAAMGLFRRHTAQAVSVEQKPAGRGVDMQERLEFLKEDLKHLFDDQGVDQSQYDDRVNFMDPITKYNSVKGYMFNIGMLKTIFSPTFQMHDIRQTGEYEITTRWTMMMRPTLNRISPFRRWWDPTLVFTGVSIMGINPENGKFNQHIDLWDALEPENQEFLSREGVSHVLSQLTSLSRAPDLDTPHFTILKKKKKYEIRRYEPFVVAETDMQPSSSGQKPGPSGEGGSAFNALAGYIFGKNDRQQKMSMTTPVFTDSQGKMQFVVSTQQGSLSQLPGPLSDSVRTREEAGGLFAVSVFSGKASEEVAKQKVAELRDSLRADRVDFYGSKWLLARYNDPSTRPAFRRNEVLVPVKEFNLWNT